MGLKIKASKEKFSCQKRFSVYFTAILSYCYFSAALPKSCSHLKTLNTLAESGTYVIEGDLT